MKIDTQINQTLPPSFYKRDTVLVAQELLGKYIVSTVHDQLCVGMITETEAYCSDDPACHAYRGKTERNAMLFGDVGHAYIYCSYGLHFCLNVVARHEDMLAGGVLLRAIQPLAGHEYMQSRRAIADMRILAN